MMGYTDNGLGEPKLSFKEIPSLHATVLKHFGLVSETPAPLRLDDYQRQAATTMIYKEKVLYPALGLGNEAGEVQGKIKKVLRDGEGLGKITPEQRAGILAECGDVLWYITAILTDLRATFTDIVPYTFETFDEVQHETDFEGKVEGEDGIELSVHLLQAATWVQSALVKVLKEEDGDVNGISTDSRRRPLANLDETFMYLVALINELGGELAEVAQENLDKLLSRAERGVIGGSGDKR